MKKPKDLKDTIKAQLAEIIDGESEPPPWKLQALKVGVSFLAAEAKLEENEYGEFFGGDAGGVQAEPAREEPATRRRKRNTISVDGDPGGETRQ